MKNEYEELVLFLWWLVKTMSVMAIVIIIALIPTKKEREYYKSKRGKND